MSIGIDLDEVVADTLDAIIKFHNERYGTDFKKTDFRSYRFWETWGGTRDESIKEVLEFFSTDRFTNLTPVAGSLRAMKAMKKAGHDLFIITGRQTEIIKETEAWIEEYFPNIFSGLHFANTYGITGQPRKKSDICKALGIKWMVEDDLDHAIECGAAGISVLLFNQPWNQGELPANAKRVFSWSDVVKSVA